MSLIKKIFWLWIAVISSSTQLFSYGCKDENNNLLITTNTGKEFEIKKDNPAYGYRYLECKDIGRVIEGWNRDRIEYINVPNSEDKFILDKREVFSLRKDKKEDMAIIFIKQDKLEPTLEGDRLTKLKEVISTFEKDDKSLYIDKYLDNIIYYPLFFKLEKEGIMDRISAKITPTKQSFKKLQIINDLKNEKISLEDILENKTWFKRLKGEEVNKEDKIVLQAPIDITLKDKYKEYLKLSLTGDKVKIKRKPASYRFESPKEPKIIDVEDYPKSFNKFDLKNIVYGKNYKIDSFKEYLKLFDLYSESKYSDDEISSKICLNGTIKENNSFIFKTKWCNYNESKIILKPKKYPDDFKKKEYQKSIKFTYNGRGIDPADIKYINKEIIIDIKIPNDIPFTFGGEKREIRVRIARSGSKTITLLPTYKKYNLNLKCISKKLDISNNQLYMDKIKRIPNTRREIEIDGQKVKCGESVTVKIDTKTKTKTPIIKGFGECKVELKRHSITCIERDLKAVVVYMPFGDDTFLKYLYSEKKKRGEYRYLALTLGDYIEEIRDKIEDNNIFIQHYKIPKSAYRFGNSDDIFRNIKRRFKGTEAFDLNGNTFIKFKKIIFYNKANIKILFFSTLKESSLKKAFCSNNDKFMGKAIILNFAKNVKENLCDRVKVINTKNGKKISFTDFDNIINNNRDIIIKFLKGEAR